MREKQKASTEKK